MTLPRIHHLAAALLLAAPLLSPLGAQRRLYEPVPPPPPAHPPPHAGAPVILFPVWGWPAYGHGYDTRRPRVDTVYVARDTIPAPARDRGVRPADPMFAWQVDAPAVRVDSASLPPYPAELAERRIAGRVVAQFVVDTEGVPDPRTFRVLYTTDRIFSDLIREWLPGVRYASARSRGAPVAQLVEETFTWAH